jgi:FlaG/FlaF family flagellin (archaellin)
VGDFNGDGMLDLAVTTGDLPGTASVDILLGNGDGTFRPYVAYPIDLTTGPPTTVLTGDFNGDGLLDLVVAGYQGMEILLGNGDGSFGKPAFISSEYYIPTAADFNGDGILDLAATANNDSVGVFLGKGDGTFSPAVPYRVPGSANTIIAGGFDNDRSVDLAVIVSDVYNVTGTTGIALLRGRGDGTFGKPVTSDFPIYYAGVAAGDFNGDGRLDFVFDVEPSECCEGTIAVFPQTTASLAPNFLSFPATVDGVAAAPITTTLTNTGTATLHISQATLGGSNSGDFSIVGNTCVGAALPSSGNCTITAGFTPGALGPRTATITIANDASVSPQTAYLQGNGTYLSASPAQLTFGNVNVGAISGYQIVTLTNNSASAVGIMEISITGTNKGDFYQFNTCETSLNPDASCSIVVRFIPTGSGTKRANIAVDQSVTGANPQPVPLSGTGT